VKLKFLVNPGTRLVTTAQILFFPFFPRTFSATLAAALMAVTLAPQTFAQQPESPASPRPSPSQDAPPADASVALDPPDPAADQGTESMFPHFKGSRFWLSGQANFIFQTFLRSTVARIASAHITRRRPRAW